MPRTSYLARRAAAVALGMTLAVTGLATPASAAAADGVGINAGGGALFGLLADTDFVGGSTTDCRCSVAPASPDPIQQFAYTTNRYGDFSYVIPGLTAAATYELHLYFAETFWTDPGQRVFNVDLVHADGSRTVLLTDFDIVAAAGRPKTGIERSFRIPTETDGSVILKFSTVRDNAQVNALTLAPVTD